MPFFRKDGGTKGGCKFDVEKFLPWKQEAGGPEISRKKPIFGLFLAGKTNRNKYSPPGRTESR
jgi:hypothetical protein